jgi:hypothetical protein
LEELAGAGSSLQRGLSAREAAGGAREHGAAASGARGALMPAGAGSGGRDGGACELRPRRARVVPAGQAVAALERGKRLPVRVLGRAPVAG